MFCYFLDFGHTSGICGLLLLKGLVLGKSQSHSLRHFDVSSGTIFHASCLRFVQRLGPKGTDATLETSLDQVVVHTGIKRRNKQTYEKELVV